MELSNQNNNRQKWGKTRKPAIDLSVMAYGKLPPQAKDLESAILGACMLDKLGFATVFELVRPECFYVDSHQRIFRAFISLSQKNSPIDILTVVEELKFTEELETVGGPFYVTQLTNSVVSAANIEAHSRIVLQKFVSREIIRICGEYIAMAYEDTTDVFDMLDEFSAAALSVNEIVTTSDIKDMATNAFHFLESFDYRIKHAENLTGVPSGFYALDECTFGWQETDLIILAARPSVGKTCLAINFAINAAKDLRKPTPVGLFSLEMSAGQITDRIVTAETHIAMSKIRRGRVTDEEAKTIRDKVSKDIEKLKIYIDDTAGLTWMEFTAKARRMVGKFGVKLIMIDYLQLMQDVNDGQKKNREQQISTITRQLKKCAKELKVPIIALSQLSRAGEGRTKEFKEPVLSDLRESGAIEQDADLVAFIYRPEYHNINVTEQGESTAGETYIRIAKHRNGNLEKIKLIAKLTIQKFFSPDDPYLSAVPGSITAGANFKTNDFDEGFEDGEFTFKGK